MRVRVRVRVRVWGRECVRVCVRVRVRVTWSSATIPCAFWHDATSSAFAPQLFRGWGLGFGVYGLWFRALLVRA